jgi:hypothetical protein
MSEHTVFILNPQSKSILVSWRLSINWVTISKNKSGSAFRKKGAGGPNLTDSME